jgi:hypothetical protein
LASFGRKSRFFVTFLRKMSKKSDKKYGVCSFFFRGVVVSDLSIARFFGILGCAHTPKSRPFYPFKNQDYTHMKTLNMRGKAPLDLGWGLSLHRKACAWARKMTKNLWGL